MKKTMADFDDIFTASGESTKHAPAAEPFDKELWAQQKQAEREHLYRTIDETALLVAASGSVFSDYLNIQSRFDRYSTGNILLVLAQNPEATRLADFKTWKDLNASVKKGAVGISILEPGEEYTKEDGTIGVSYTTKKVFDISQTTFEEPARSEPVRDERLLIRALINEATVEIRPDDRIPGNEPALYDPSRRTIYIRPGMDGPDIFWALSRELAHAEMDKGDYIRNDCRFQAYCASYIICKRNGIDVAPYPSERLPVYYDTLEAREIRKELTTIRETANALCGRMTRILEPDKPYYKQRDDSSR